MYEYAQPTFCGGTVWRSEQRWNGHTATESRALYAEPMPANADELARIAKDAYMEARLDADTGDADWREKAEQDWKNSAARERLEGGR